MIPALRILAIKTLHSDISFVGSLTSTCLVRGWYRVKSSITVFISYANLYLAICMMSQLHTCKVSIV